MGKDSLSLLLALHMFSNNSKNAHWCSEVGISKNQFHSLYTFEKSENFLEKSS